MSNYSAFTTNNMNDWMTYHPTISSFPFDCSSITKSIIEDALKEPVTPSASFKEDMSVSFDHISSKSLDICRIIFSYPCTIVLWADGTKTIVRVKKGEPYSPYYGLCTAITKRLFGSGNKIAKCVDYWTEVAEKAKDKK